MNRLANFAAFVVLAQPDAPSGPPLTDAERSELEALRKEVKATMLATEMNAGGVLPPTPKFRVHSPEKDKKPSGWVDHVFARVKAEHVDGDEGDLTDDEKTWLVQQADRRYNSGDRRIDAADLNRLAAIAAKLGIKPRHVSPVAK